MSIIPSDPFAVPQMICVPSGDISTADTVPSCGASIKYSEKSKSQTLSKWSSLPVTQNPSFTEIDWIGPSWIWKAFSSFFEW